MRIPRNALPAGSCGWWAVIWSAGVVGFAISGLVSWFFEVQFWAGVFPEYIPMAPSAAVSFLLLGVLLFLRTWKVLPSWIGLGAVLVAVYGLLNFLELFIGVDLSFEEVLFPATRKFGEVIINRMSPLSGFIFFLAGISLRLIWGQQEENIGRSLGGFLGTLVAFGGFTGIMGYLFGTPLLYGCDIIPMALSASCAFLLLGLGLMIGTGPEVWPLRLLLGSSIRARLLRVFLPLTVGAVLLQGLLNDLLPMVFHNYALGTVLLALCFALITGGLVTIAGQSLGSTLDLAESERRRAEEKLHKSYRELQETTGQLAQSRNMLHLIIESAPVRVFWKDKNLRYLGCNTLFARDAGFSYPQQLLGKDDFVMGWREQAELYRADDRQVMETRHPKKDIIEPQTTPTGEKIWLRTSKVPLATVDGEVLGVLGVYDDITASKEAEQALRESEERLAGIVQSVTDHMSMIDRNYNILWANAVAERLFGPNLVGRKCYQCYRRQDEPCEPCVVAQVFQDGRIHEQSAPLITIDNRTRYFWCTASVAGLHADGRPQAVVEVSRDITERMQAEQALEEEAIRRRLLVEESRDGIVVLDQTGKVYEANRRYAEMLGYSPEEVRQLYIWDWDDRWSREELLEQIRRVDASGDHFETRHRRKDGTLLDVEISTNGAVIGGQKLVFCVCRDISLRKSAEQALRESEEKFRLVFEKAPIGIMHYDRTSTVTECNQKFEEIIGASKEYFIGFNMIRQLRDDKMRQAVAASLRGEVGYYEDNYLSVTGGKLTTVRAIFQPILSSEESVLGGVAIMEDITARKQAEAALQVARESLELALEGADLGTWDWNCQTGVVTFNERWAEMLGYRLEEIEPQVKSWEKLVHPEDLPVVMEVLNAHLEGKTPFYEVEHRLQHKSGSWVWILDRGKVIERDATGRPMRACGTHLDITERRRAQEDRLRFSKLESLATLAGGIAHDFNNILTAILGNISLAKLERDEGERLTDAERACLQAKALAHQLLTFAKGGSPIMELLSVANLIRETASFACRGSQVVCEYDLPENLWMVHADAGQLGQVFQNLVINAVQAMPMGGAVKILGENIIVEIGTNLPLNPGKYVKIIVQDRGVGIPTEYLTRIFDPYFTTKQMGSGLGLATVYSIIKAHKGHIAVESTLGLGTAFEVYLPAVTEKIVKPTEGNGQVVKGEGRILVMDDEAMVREILGKMLHYLGYQAVFARDGQEAIEQFGAAQQSGAAFDAVILDLTIPGGMGGKGAINELLRLDPRIKAIVSSGYADDPIMANFREYGFKGVVTKPYRIIELSKVLQEVVGNRQ
ncbi:PAS domain-containing hybrid sensor histidine kinase/response regulator [Desulfobacca acetoxidans]